ncbi:MAG TPA: hypothetical protein VGD98_10080 [Ktedonobacteraceae bacterium]
MMLKKLLQRVLLVAGVIALLVVLVDLVILLAATIPAGTPARVSRVTAGPYQLTVSMYTYPANAGYAFPFAVAPAQAINGSLTMQVFSIPGQGVDATPIRAEVNSDPHVHNSIQGAAEITVKGPWTLQIRVNGPAGAGVANVPIIANALPAVPAWFGWLIGFIPFYVLAMFFLLQTTRSQQAVPVLQA